MSVSNGLSALGGHPALIDLRRHCGIATAVQLADGSAAGSFRHLCVADGFTYDVWGMVTCAAFATVDSGKQGPSALEHTTRMQRARLRSSNLDFWGDIAVIALDDRWLAVAWIGGDADVGYGNKSVTAMADALSSLGPAATASLLSDLDVQRT
jgi:hypothetical protein